MNQKVYCVMEGGNYPEGAPYAIFATIDEAKNYIEKNNLENRYESTCIYVYSLGGDGHEVVLNYLGEEIK